MLQLIAVGKEPNAEIADDPLNTYVRESAPKFAKFFKMAVDVPTSEEHFNIDQYVDMAGRKKPTIVLNLQEIYTVHIAVFENIDYMAPQNANDPLRRILSDLGSTPVLPEDEQLRNQEIRLTLINKFANLESTFITFVWV